VCVCGRSGERAFTDRALVGVTYGRAREFVCGRVRELPGSVQCAMVVVVVVLRPHDRVSNVGARVCARVRALGMLLYCVVCVRERERAFT
jgi:hypothetical protein